MLPAPSVAALITAALATGALTKAALTTAALITGALTKAALITGALTLQLVRTGAAIGRPRRPERGPQIVGAAPGILAVVHRQPPLIACLTLVQRTV